MDKKKSNSSLVTLFRTQTCSWCHKEAKFLKEHKIKFQSIDVGTNTKKAGYIMKKTGQTSVPQIEIIKKGKSQYIVGFDERMLRKALNIKD